jgi:Zn finger protein HypA/HybF involved in hydrogenase expression
MAIYILADDDTNTWECSDCREWWTLNSGSPKDNYMNYCPHCGGKITECKTQTLQGLIDGME